MIEKPFFLLESTFKVMVMQRKELCFMSLHLLDINIKLQYWRGHSIITVGLRGGGGGKLSKCERMNPEEGGPHVNANVRL